MSDLSCPKVPELSTAKIIKKQEPWVLALLLLLRLWLFRLHPSLQLWRCVNVWMRSRSLVKKSMFFCPQTQFGQTGRGSVNTPVCDLLWDLFDLLLFDWNLKSASCSSLILSVSSLCLIIAHKVFNHLFLYLFFVENWFEIFVSLLFSPLSLLPPSVFQSWSF